MAAEKNILVVEDDMMIRNTFVEILESEGYTVIPARNGKEALRYLEVIDDVDLVFLDLMMPIMNGWEFLQAMRSGQGPLKSPPIVVVSAVGDKELASATHIKAVLSKPTDIDKLLAIADRYCRPSDLN